jgi:hypothetical protein
VFVDVSASSSTKFQVPPSVGVPVRRGFGPDVIRSPGGRLPWKSRQV